ncbi:Nitroreductase domain-containing protein [Burkholderia multivorans]
MKNMLRKFGRAVFKAFPGLRSFYDVQRTRFAFAKASAYHVRDALHTHRHMRWKFVQHNYWKLSSELIFQYHKLEKGLCIPGKKRFFGAEPAFCTVRLVNAWGAAGYPTHDSIYVAALETLRAYRARLDVTPPPDDIAARLTGDIDACLANRPLVPAMTTPIPHTVVSPGTFDVLRDLCIARRSVRSYRERPVPTGEVKAAIAVAQLSPSACNRQPWRVHLYQDREKIDAMLALQNGNAGFGRYIQMLLVIAADSHSFFDGSERNEPYIDAGLFSMTLILALQARGLSSCCLNWCVAPETDLEAHRRGGIPENERIVMFLAVGYAADEAVVPRSVRRSIESLTVLH